MKRVRTAVEEIETPFRYEREHGEPSCDTAGCSGWAAASTGTAAALFVAGSKRMIFDAVPATDSK